MGKLPRTMRLRPILSQSAGARAVGVRTTPYDLSYTSWGSSSGSANGAAANLCSVAVGTETDGSITGPSAVENIVGLKPTLGLVSQDGIIPIAHRARHGWTDGAQRH